MNNNSYADGEMIGRTFGRLTVKVRLPIVGVKTYICQCSCGGEKIARGVNLRSGSTKSCGCLYSISKMKSDYKDIIGKQFSRLTPIEALRTDAGRAAFLCKCVCGNQKVVEKSNLLSRSTKSCGCLRKRIAISEGI